jgi:hypothetical protein
MTPNHERLDEAIARLSEGRVTFDPRGRRLSMRDEAGRVEATIDISETALRNWLQRLLLAGPGRVGLEPQESAVLLLVDRLDGTVAGPDDLSLVS